MKGNRYIVISSKHKMQYKKPCISVFLRYLNLPSSRFMYFKRQFHKMHGTILKKDHSGFLQVQHFYKFLSPLR